MKKHISLLIISILSISFIVTILSSSSFILATFWDTMFACSLGLTLIGASMHILNSGFFNSYVQQFKSFFRQISRSEQLASELERKNNHSNMSHFELPLAAPFTITGIILTIISSVISVIIF